MVGMALQADVRYFAFWAQILLAMAERRRHIFDLELGIVVVLIRGVTHHPHQARGHGFWARLEAHFRAPLLPFRVVHVELRAGAVNVLLFELDRKFRPALFSAGTPV